MDRADVVIVGGGIAGSSLGYALASAGKQVVVLEASREFEDRVRGEQMHAWGVKEARDLGVESALLDAGAHVATSWRQYVEGAPEPMELPVSRMVPGIEGTLNLRHPDACQALLDSAARVGARVERGVQDVTLGSDSTTPSPMSGTPIPTMWSPRWWWAQMDGGRWSGVSPASDFVETSR